MELNRLRLILKQLVECKGVELEGTSYGEKADREITEQFGKIQKLSNVVLNLLSPKLEQNVKKKGCVYSGSLEEAVRSKETFLENASLFCKKKEITNILDQGQNIMEGISENQEENPTINVFDKVDVKVEDLKCMVVSDYFEKKGIIHSCEDCDFKDTNCKVLKKHITLTHGRKEKPYKKCKFCIEEFQMRKDQEMNSRYRNHLEKLHKKEDFSEFQEAFDKMNSIKCPVCDKSVYGSRPNDSFSNLSRHMKDKHENKNEKKETISCPKCEKIINVKYLKKHLELTHNDAKFTCDICGKSSKNKQQMRLHVKVHSSEPGESFKCDICDEMIPPSGSLRLHMYAKHGGRKLKPVTCDQCGKQLSDISKLNKHKDSVHLNKKPFKCDICDLNMSRIDNLNQHKIKVHNFT